MSYGSFKHDYCRSMRLIFRIEYSETTESGWHVSQYSFKYSRKPFKTSHVRWHKCEADFSTNKRHRLFSIVWHVHSKNKPPPLSLYLFLSLYPCHEVLRERSKRRCWVHLTTLEFSGNFLLVILATAVTSLWMSMLTQHRLLCSGDEDGGTNNGKYPSVDSKSWKRALM